MKNEISSAYERHSDFFLEGVMWEKDKDINFSLIFISGHLLCFKIATEDTSHH